MKKSTKAALLSGLIFPGIGHVVLKKYGRGAVLIVGALAAASVMFNIAARQAQIIVDQMVSGELPPDAGSILETVANASGGANGQSANLALIVLGVCWLIGIVDSWRIGRALENAPERPANPSGI